MNIFRMRKWKKRLGAVGERTAARMLCDKGLDILVRNCRTRRAELDIVARDGGMLVFVEVKTRYRKRYESRELRPASQLKDAQKRRIYRGAFCYLREIGNPSIPFRFDLVEVVCNAFGPCELRHWPDHFGRPNREKTVF